MNAIPRIRFTIVLISTWAFACAAVAQTTIEMVYTSDPHYGLTRRFLQTDGVTAQTVSQALIQKVNTLPGRNFPQDGGVEAGSVVGPIDYLIETGDIGNRSEAAKSIQSAATSWSQFYSDYSDDLTLQDRSGQKTQLLLAPGNHDASNAIGFYRALFPLTDATVMTEIYNRMVQPALPATALTYAYSTNKVNYSRNIGGVHFLFMNIWPDSANRVWMETDLAHVPATTPVLLFTHDPPDVEPKHFTNPNGTHDVNSIDQFENLLHEVFKDDANVTSTAAIEQRAFAAFLKAHANIKAYFHGHDNYNEFYQWSGPDNDMALPTFRVDSPMKGNTSSSDETKLSFQVIALDTQTLDLTVREYLWNPDSTNGSAVPIWGTSKTISLLHTNTTQSISAHASTPQIRLKAILHQSTLEVTQNLQGTAPMTLRVFDTSGHRITSATQPTAAQHSFALNIPQQATSAGLYLVTLSSGNQVASTKVVAP